MRHLSLILICFMLSLSANAQIFEVGANTAALPFASLDAESGIAVGKGHTISIGALIRPIYPSRLFYLRTICRKYRNQSNCGPFLAVSGGYLNYSDSEYHGQGITLGASIGYRFILTKRLDLSLEAGATMTVIKDSRYITTPGLYSPDYIQRRDRLMLMPFPLSLSLYYLF